MNSINKDLVFTVEVPEQFSKNRLPTLDFSLWLEDWLINHTYYEKDMKTPYVIMKRSAISCNQRAAILANELVRRLSNVNHEHVPNEEIIEVMEGFIKQLKNSEYPIKEAREHTINGIKGWKGKVKKREKDGTGMYRSGKSTLKGRVKKKLMERESWYRIKEKEGESDAEDDQDKSSFIKPRNRGEKRKKEEGEEDLKKELKVEMKKRKVNPTKAPMFVPFTTHGGLAKDLRQNETHMKEIDGTMLKIVEKCGTKIMDILTNNNPWRGMDCLRLDCLQCQTKAATGKKLTQDCRKRNLVYETYCRSCEEKELEKIEEDIKGLEKK